MEVSVIVPLFNEEEHAAESIRRFYSYFEACSARFELILIDDGSTDRTPEILKAAALSMTFIKIIRHPRCKGKGQAVKTGILRARYPVCLFMDADHSTPVEEWEKFVPHFKNGERAVIASRHIPGSRILRPQPFSRRFMGSIYRILCRRIFASRCSDFNCGFKAFNTTLAQDIFGAIQMFDWTFDVEIFCLLKRRGIKHKEVPVTWSHKSKKSNLLPFRAAWESLISLLRLAKRFRRKTPGCSAARAPKQTSAAGAQTQEASK